MQKRTLALAHVFVVLGFAGCRKQTAPVLVDAGQFGVGSGYTASCNGDFPSWISSNPPVAGQNGDVNPSEPGVQHAFELAQSYPLGIPVFVNNHLDHYDPPQPNTDAPWRSYTNLNDVTDRTNYLNALKNYVFSNMADPSITFDATKNNQDINNRFWYHVPMMTAAGTKRREPYHGVTEERALRPSEQTHWLNGTTDLRAVAIGYYNFLGGYTIGQVFKSGDLSQTDPTKGRFIDGTLVFKLLFAEYQSARIVAPDPLAHAPSWWVQDPGNPSAPPFEVRLLQVDVAVKDDHFASTTGWVFSTFVYDESLTATVSNPWKRLTPVGIMWGNDPTVTGTTGTLNQTWINPSMPAAFKDHLGRAGRLIGPVDDPVSSCLSCHSTAEVDPSQATHEPAYNGAATKPPTGCTDPMDWFRNLPSGTAFGHGITCPVNTATTGLIALDYSLQMQEGVGSVFGFGNSNPCFGVTLPNQPPQPPLPPPPPRPGQRDFHYRTMVKAPSMVKIEPKHKQVVGPDPDPATVR